MKRIGIGLFLFFVFVLCTQRSQAQTGGTRSSILFSPTTIATKPGETFSTQLWLDTDQAQVAGIDAKITFDPKLLSVVKIDTLPVFPDYPATVFDNALGSAHISGIVRNKNELYTGKAQFATITWKANTSGDGSIALSFKNGATNDSNLAVTYGNGDILQQVNTVSIRVAAVSQPDSSIQTNATAITQPQSPQKPIPISAVELTLIVLIILSIASQMYLHLRLRNIEKLREPIPHLYTQQ